MSKKRSLPTLVVAFWLSVGISGGCDQDRQYVRIAAQDYRFDPRQVELEANLPVELTVVNQGRETHEFTSRVLRLGRKGNTAAFEEGSVPDKVTSIRLRPGEVMHMVLDLVPGVYAFRCAIRGHRGMDGVLIVH